MDIDSRIQELLNDSLLTRLHSEAGAAVESKSRVPSGLFDLVKDESGFRAWLKQALRAALQIEMTVIPPYLVALWSIKISTPARSLIADVAQEEMLHMSLVCNCLAALGDDPPVVSPEIVPVYPANLPAGILPALQVKLASYSEDLILSSFVPIEQPFDSSFRWSKGQRFWTIGAFYELLELVLRHAPANWFSDRHQLTDARLELTKVTSPTEAADAMLLIREQGEGTPGPLFGTDPFSDVAHYFRFWEILHHKRIEVHGNGTWSFTGVPVPAVKPNDVYTITRVADESLPESRAFDDMYTQMLQDFADAWKTGDQQILDRARDHMLELPNLVQKIFDVTLHPETGECYGPRFEIR